jgi:hypothetical protein
MYVCVTDPNTKQIRVSDVEVHLIEHLEFKDGDELTKYVLNNIKVKSSVPIEEFLMSIRPLIWVFVKTNAMDDGRDFLEHSIGIAHSSIPVIVKELHRHMTPGLKIRT